MSTHNICFKLRNKKNYPKIITKYTSLTSPLVELSMIKNTCVHLGLVGPFWHYGDLIREEVAVCFAFRCFIICHGLCALPLGVIARLYSVIMALPGCLYYFVHAQFAYT